MEEDQKVLEEFIELDRKIRQNKVESDYDEFCERRCIAIENLLKAYKELEEKYNYEKNRARTELDTVYINARYDERDKWKSKVKEKIEEIDEKIKYENNEKVLIWLHKQKRVLQSLLEEE